MMNLPSCCTRADILRQLKIAFRELVMTEEFHLEGDAYYATLGLRTCKWQALPSTGEVH